MKISINRSLLPVKAYYFFNYAAQAAIFPYLPVFAKELGLSSKELAVVYGIFPALIVIYSPIIGYITDKYQSQKFVLVLLKVIQVIFILPLYYLPFIEKSPSGDAEFTCIKNTSKITMDGLECISIKNETMINCSFCCDFSQSMSLPLIDKLVFEGWHLNDIVYRNVTVGITMEDEAVEILPSLSLHLSHHPEDAFITSTATDLFCGMETSKTICKLKQCVTPACVISKKITTSFLFTSFQFWIFLFFRVMSDLARSSSDFLGDSIALEKLKDKHLHYGRQRLMGSLGWGISCLIFGLINDIYSENKLHIDYVIGFYSFTVLIVCTALIITVCFKNVPSVKSNHIPKNICTLFHNPEISLFAIMTCLVGMGHWFLKTYLFWYMEELGASQLNLGLGGFLSCIAEIILFFYSGSIIKKLGHAWVAFLVLISFCFRMFLCAILDNTWWMVPVQLFHGITFGLCYANITSFVKTIAPPGALATTQEVFGAFFYGVGGVMGNLVGGLLFNGYGGRQTFLGFAIGSAGVAFLYLITHCVIKNMREELNREDSESPDLTSDISSHLEPLSTSITRETILEPSSSPVLKEREPLFIIV